MGARRPGGVAASGWAVGAPRFSLLLSFGAWPKESRLGGMQQRITELDLLRTLAIVLMLVYHTAYDLWAFFDYDIDLWGGTWQTVRIVTASIFLIVSGAASHFSRNLLRRALIVLGCAMVITLITYVYDPDTFIYYGILHLIGMGMLILIPLRRLKEWLIPLGLALTLTPPLTPPQSSLDFYSPTPWIGLMLLGSGIGYFLFVRNQFSILNSQFSILRLPAQHALLIYLLHQPLLLSILYLLH